MAKEKPYTLSELNDVVQRLSATATFLTELQQRLASGTSGGKGKRGPRTTPRRTARRKNKPGDATKLRDRILQYLGSRKGAASRDIANALSSDIEAVTYALNVLRAKRKVRMTGARSTAQWHSR
jgi:hypothetical protein